MRSIIKDYEALNSTLNWANGESGEKNVTITIIDDTVLESDEAFKVILSSTTGGAHIETPSNATVSVIENDVDSDGFAVGDKRAYYGQGARDRISGKRV